MSRGSVRSHGNKGYMPATLMTRGATWAGLTRPNPTRTCPCVAGPQPKPNAESYIPGFRKTPFFVGAFVSGGDDAIFIFEERKTFLFVEAAAAAVMVCIGFTSHETHEQINESQHDYLVGSLVIQPQVAMLKLLQA
ncbi:hypothetical protein ACLOJK_005377 [Asimina triloba]